MPFYIKTTPLCNISKGSIFVGQYIIFDVQLIKDPFIIPNVHDLDYYT